MWFVYVKIDKTGTYSIVIRNVGSHSAESQIGRPTLRVEALQCAGTEGHPY
jgi:hypothetical protein